jgi:hypothetical protein
MLIFAKARADDKSINGKVKGVLEELWDRFIEVVEAGSPRALNLPTTSLDVSGMKESTLSGAKKQERLYQDL